MQETNENKLNKDVRAKEIFDNPELCAQFIRGYVGIPMLKGVQPQDIEEMRIRYHFFDGEELESDSVKRIRIRELDSCEAISEVYLVALIEHKSYVDYDVAMQLLRYMVCIWYDWEKEQEEKRRKGLQEVQTHDRKAFRYPPIIPIVYYEGKQRWTAGMQLKDRIYMSEQLAEYIPNFTYRIVENRKYSEEDLLLRGDEISLIMLLNKIQAAGDMKQYADVPPEQINGIIKNSSQPVLNELAKIVQTLCAHLNLTDAETRDYTQRVKERNMGYLFENMEKIDIQAERRKTAEERMKADEARKKADEAEKRLGEVLEQQKRNLVQICGQLNGSRETAIVTLTDRLGLSEEEAKEAVGRYWE